MYSLSMLVGRVSRVAVVAGLVWCAPTRAEAQVTSRPTLEILGSDSVTTEADSGIVRHTAFIRNPAPVPVSMSISLVLRPDSGRMVTLAARETGLALPGASVRGYDLEFDIPAQMRNRAFTGYLVVGESSGSLVPATRWISVSAPQKVPPPSKPLFGNVILLPLLLALGPVLIAAILLWKFLPRWMVGTPTWDFAKSWASTTTIATVFANGALTALLPDTTQKGSLVLAAIFTILVVIAPNAYNLSLRPVAGSDAEPRYEGHVLSYLLASTLTLWGVFGALYAGYLLISQISWEGVTADKAIRLFEILPILIVGLIAAYAIATIRRTVVEQAGGLALSAAGRKRVSDAVEFAPAPRSAREVFPLL